MGKPDNLTQEEMDLRRRARRRLVGAIALVLLAVVVLPMLFDPEPKPLGPGVEIQIPDQATPFVPAAPSAEGVPQVKPPASAEMAGQSVPAAAPAAMAPPVVAEKPAAAETPVPAEPPPVQAKAKETPAVKAKPAPPARPKETPEAKKPAPQTPVADAAASQTAGAEGYYLQLGAFGNEKYAKAMADKARKAGFKVVVQEVDGQLRVRVGPYADRDEAVAVQGKLREKEFKSVLLGP